MQKITTFLWFDTEAEEAATFYTSLFPDSRITHVQRYGEAGPGQQGTVMIVNFELAGQQYIALNGGPDHPFTEAISLYIDCASQAEVDELWAKLAADGGEEGPCGWVKDRYGLSWQVVPRTLIDLISDPDPGRSQRAMKAMLGMGKIVVQELVEAANG
jgi:predicted 3-demethylubiquinone-9 3-methyltransferase (glyoxalase superfamily)